ncbi:MAG TPA: nicotinate-nucleotide--dimethylbenzimidazole phosphoribosyltransferase [Thermodesulfobacteriota bacterium]
MTPRWRAAAGAVRPLPADGEAQARARLDRLTKPRGSLGRLEDLAARVAALQGTDRPVAAPAAVFVFAADHGVAADGVSAYPQVVTREMIKNFIKGGAAVNALARAAGAEVVVVDVGVAGDPFGAPGAEVAGPGGRLLCRRVRPGSASLLGGPALTPADVEAALDVGAALAAEAAGAHLRVAAVGDMGIGNTTPAAAVVAALLGLPPERTVGRGTGVDDAGLGRKRAAVAAGLSRLGPRAVDPLAVLAEVGGLEIAAMAGFLLGAAAARLPVVLDGVVTGAAALAAARLAPAAADGWIAAHRSPEPAHGAVLDALRLRPLLDLEMRLGEGSGACLGLGLVAAACRMLREMATFEEAEVSEAPGEPGR